MQLILVSSCLLGERVRYHGGHALCDHPMLARWLEQGRIRAVCPEVAAGMRTPRACAEIAGSAGGRRVLEGHARVVTRDGTDVTGAFVAGAKAAIELARSTGAQVAILKDGSPSCGSCYVADGSFQGRRIAQEGVTSAALRALGIAVFNEHQIEQAGLAIESLEAGDLIDHSSRPHDPASQWDWCI